MVIISFSMQQRAQLLHEILQRIVLSSYFADILRQYICLLLMPGNSTLRQLKANVVNSNDSKVHKIDKNQNELHNSSKFMMSRVEYHLNDNQKFLFTSCFNKPQRLSFISNFLFQNLAQFRFILQIDTQINQFFPYTLIGYVG